MSRSIFENTRTLHYVFEKYHMLIIQHLTPKDLLTLTGCHVKLNYLFSNCEACMNKIHVRFDVIEAKDPEDFRVIMRSNRNYRNFRFMCYGDKEFSKYCIEMIEVFSDMLSLDVFDMVVGKRTKPEHLLVLPKLQYLRLLAHKGPFQHIFMMPGKHYKKISFESMRRPVDLKTLGGYETATENLTLKNSKFSNLDTFNFFGGVCKEFVFEVDKRGGWDGVFVILRRYCKLKELKIVKKSSAGIRLILNYEKKEEYRKTSEKSNTTGDKSSKTSGKSSTSDDKLSSLSSKEKSSTSDTSSAEKSKTLLARHILFDRPIHPKSSLFAKYKMKKSSTSDEESEEESSIFGRSSNKFDGPSKERSSLFEKMFFKKSTTFDDKLNMYGSQAEEEPSTSGGRLTFGSQPREKSSIFGKPGTSGESSEKKSSTMSKNKSDEEMEVDSDNDEMEVDEEPKAVLFTRRSYKKSQKDDVPDCGNIKVTVEVDNFSVILIKHLAEILTSLKILKISNFHSSSASEAFSQFPNLEKLFLNDKEILSDSINKKSSDPVSKLPFKLLPLMFQHLELDELVSTTLVSQKWNDTIGSLDFLTDLIEISLKPENFKKNEDVILKKSLRKLKKLEIACDSNSKFSLSALEIVHVFSSSLVNLTLKDVYLEKVSTLQNRFIFHNLETIVYNNTNENACIMLLQNARSLKSVTISSIDFSKKIIKHLKNCKYLKELILIDCTFESFRKMRTEKMGKDDKVETFRLSIKSFGLMFDRANAWKVQEDEAFKKFLKLFTFIEISEVLFSGVRCANMAEILRLMSHIKKVTFKHFWENEVNSKDFYRIREPFELNLLNFGMGKRYNWKEMFSNAYQINVTRERQNGVDKNEVMTMPLSKIVRNRLYSIKNSEKTSKDPVLNIPEKFHELMFQHFTGKDVLNAFEVSKTWNNFVKTSNVCAEKYIIFIKNSSKREDLAVVEKSSRLIYNLVTDFYQPKMIKEFSNLKKLSLALIVPGNFTSVTFSRLDTLIIQKCHGKFYNHENILLCLKMFSKCDTLTYFELYEAITIENYELIQDLLANNHKLKTLIIHQCSEFYHLFSEDFSHRIHFQLENLDYRIPSKFSIVGSNFEQFCTRFIRKQTSLKVVDFNLCSAVMLNAVFKLPYVHTVRSLRISGYDHVDLQRNENIKEFLFPNTLQVNTSNPAYDYNHFFAAMPNVERLFIFSLTIEMVWSAAKTFKHLKYLTADRFDTYEVPKAIKQVINSEIEQDIVNNSMKIFRSEFRLVDFEDRSFELLFGRERDRYNN